MREEQWEKVNNLVNELLELPEEQRESVLKAQNAPPELIKEVQELIEAYAGPKLRLETEEDSMKLSEIPEKLGTYRLLKAIGQGGMGNVYLGQRDDGTFKRQVAIKTLTSFKDTPFIRERFIQERRVHAELEHSNIARLLDAGSSDSGVPFLIMEYVDGLSITDYVTRHHCSLKRRLELVIQVCSAVAFAHRKLVLHRDIKPTNIIINNDGNAILLDFGIAKLLEEHADQNQQTITAPDDRFVTLAYASPEQIEGETLTTSSDVYSLGVLLYEVLTGKRPFEHRNNYTLSTMIVEVDPIAPQFMSNKQSIAADLQAICLKALEKNADDRYQTAIELAKDLANFIEHKPISARPTTLLAKIHKFWRRNPIFAPVGALMGLAIIVSLGVAIWQANHAKQQQNIAIQSRDRAQAVTDLMLDLFDTDPLGDTEDRRADISLQTFLTTRAKDMKEQLQGQPDLKASMLDMFAVMNLGLSLLDQAEPHALEALAIRHTLFGDEHADVAVSSTTLGMLYLRQDRLDEAEPLLRQALAIRRNVLTKNHPGIADSTNNLSNLLVEYNNPKYLDEIVELETETLAIRELQFGPESVEVAQVLNNSAVFYKSRNQGSDLKKAEKLYARALKIRREKLGNKHPNTANTISNLAELLSEIGRFEEAEVHFLEAVSIIEESLGEYHFRMTAALYNLAKLYRKQQRWAEVEATLQRSLKIDQATLPETHRFVFDDVTSLVDTYINMKDKARAIEYLKRAKSMKTNQPRSKEIVTSLQSRIDTEL
jgi:serine/threonine-protein kinase